MIKLFVGQKGSGKTLQMVKDSQWFFKRGYKVYSNFPVWGYSPNGERVLKVFKKRVPTLGNFMYSEDLETTLKSTFEAKTPTLFMLDEAPVMFHSREWHNFDLDLIYALNQSRKSNVHMFMSAQMYHSLDKQLRETAEYVYLCEKKLFKPIRLFTVMVVRPDYFKEEQDSKFLKQFIVKRKLYFENSLKQYYQFYDTEQVILPARFQAKYPQLFPDPSKVSIQDIVTHATEHRDIDIPI